jgi:hypothetical protein
MSDFCRKCGASFPPKLGEGRCVDWQRCWENQEGQPVKWHIEELRYVRGDYAYSASTGY